MKKYFNGGMALILGAIMLSSCLKQKDETGDGPKAGIAIINAALDSEPLTLLLDGQGLNEQGIVFGAAGGTPVDAYLAARPGVRATAWQSGSVIPAEQKFLHWKAGGYYTLIHFDTALNGQSPWMIVEDKPEPVDTIAKARFINCVAGMDSISIWLVNPEDTVQLAQRQPYLGRTGSASESFGVKVKPGNWRYEMFSANGSLLAEGNLDLTGRGLYSFIATGETGGVGVKAPGILFLAHQVK